MAETYVVDLDAAPFCPDGWTVHEHRVGMGNVLVETRGRDLYVDGHKLVSNEQADFDWFKVYNANLLEFLLAHPELLSVDWAVNIVYFPGTLYLGPNGERFTRCLAITPSGYTWIRHDGWVETCPATTHNFY